MDTNNNHTTTTTHNAGGSSRTLQASPSSSVLTVIQHIGNKTTIPNWPTNDLDGLFDALSRWALDFSYSGCENAMALALRDPADDKVGPFRGRAWCGCFGKYDNALGRTRYYATVPMFPEHPEAVSFSGNFLGYSFGFSLVTDDPELIAKLDAAIAANMQRPDYQAALADDAARKARKVA